VIRINLLPWREELRELQKKEFFTVMGAAVGFAFLILVLIHLLMASDISSQEQRNQLLKKEISTLDSKIGEIKLLKEERDQLIARMDIVQALEGNRPLSVKLFDEMVSVIPEGSYLWFIARKGDDISLRGKAESNSEVSTLMRNIEKTGWLLSPKLTQIKTDTNKN
jgi:type IV pilus assembly protein PilN